MTNFKFIIRRPETTDQQAIYVTARFGRNDKLMYATPLKVESIFWDAQRQRVKASMYCRYSDGVNDALGKLAGLLNDYAIGVARDGGELSKDSIRRVLDRHFHKDRDGTTLHSFFLSYIEQCKKMVNGRRGGQVLTYRTMREYADVYNCLCDFEKEKRRTIDFDDVDYDFFVSFVAFLQERNLATNTIAKKVSKFKAVMAAAVNRGLCDNIRWSSYKKVFEETDAVALDEKELMLLHDYDFSANRKLERVRDLFLVSCWTGLRFSDATRIRRENIRGGFIEITQSKTNSPVVIPLHPVVSEILRKYGGIPGGISIQKFNKYIKEVCKEVGINGSVLMSITRGGRKETCSHEKWEVISSHTARRSFATNLYRSGFPAISIMQITGHKTETAFLRYIKVSKEEHARKLAQHWKEKVFEE